MTSALPRWPSGAKPARCDDAIDLAAKIGNRARLVGVGGRREQADDAKLADQPSVRAEPLDADIVEIDAAVNARAHVGLGDDQYLRLLQKFHDLRRDRAEIVAAPQDMEVVRAQEPETAIALRRVIALVVGQHIVAHAHAA